MKSKFKEYFTPSKSESAALWKDCLFIFDTNVLLNFYRYSNDTINALKEAIAHYESRVWIPYNVGFEFFERRIGVIEGQINNYQEKSKILKNLIKGFSEKKGHPFISLQLLEELRILNEKIEKEFLKNSKELTQLINHKDTVLDTIIELFENKVGDTYSIEEMKIIYTEGEYRFSNFIPPGFKDIRKEDRRKYGDYIIWKQIIDKSISTRKSVIFITDDEKDDWSLKKNNKVLGPLPELVKEFNSLTNKSFYSYNTLEFIKKSSIETNNKINKEVLDEIEYVASNKSESLEYLINGGYYTVGFAVQVNGDIEDTINRFSSILNTRGYLPVVQERNENIFYFSILVKYEDLIRRFYKLLNEIIGQLPIKLLSFNSNTINYYHTDEQ